MYLKVTEIKTYFWKLPVKVRGEKFFREEADANMQALKRNFLRPI